MGDAKEVAQVASVIGRDFPYRLVDSIAVNLRHDLDASLQRLVQSGLVFQRGVPPDVTYTFKHALVQEAAYFSLLRSTRRELHTRIAETYEEAYPEIVQSQPEHLAHHHAESGNTERAIDYRRMAGEALVRRHALLEAESNFLSAIDLLDALEDLPAAREQRLGVLMALGPVQIVLYGFPSPVVSKTYGEARALTKEV